jgi:hypothetical protein
VAIHLADGRKFVIETSANLRTNRNKEQFFLAQHADLFDFRDTWLKQEIATHAV